MINRPLLPLAYDNGRVEPLIGGGDCGEYSPVLLSAYDNRIVEHLIGGGGGGLW